MKSRKKASSRITMTLLFATLVFVSMLLSMLIVGLAIFLLARFELINFFEGWVQPLLFFALICLSVGIFVSFFVSKRPLKPFLTLVKALDEIVRGNYDVRVKPQGPDSMQILYESFNRMAEELGSVEILRSDFVNNFSHEFKTPIVSIRGFAKLLQREDLTEAERAEYLEIIISECERLSELATNVLNLSKIERQSILTDKKRVNVSEQIRLVIVMMMNKWEKKSVDVCFESDELYIFGNEDLLKQVWINILDNSMKFSKENGIVDIKIAAENEGYRFSFINHGEAISDEAAAHIFDKFYQEDESHTERGNGLGLTIAKRIVELHGGTLKLAYSNDKDTCFEVTV